jgi:hypothetical protein
VLKDEVIAWLQHIPDSEELWIVRAQDICAAGNVRDWAHRAAEAGSPTYKVNNALATADRMEKHEPRKIPD